jgi:hypothetical protein
MLASLFAPRRRGLTTARMGRDTKYRKVPREKVSASLGVALRVYAELVTRNFEMAVRMMVYANRTAGSFLNRT